MLARRYPWGAALSLIIAGTAGLAACGGGDVSTSSQGSGGSQAGSAGSGAASTGGAGGAGDAGSFAGGTSGAAGQQQAFDVQPSATQTITVAAGQSTPTVSYTATLDGSPVNV